LESDPSPANNIDFLLDHFATADDANRPDQSGSTPLHVAASFRNLAVAKVLLQSAGANVNLKRNDGKTPLDMLEHDNEGVAGSKNVHLVDDIENRTWARKMIQMKQLFEAHGAAKSLSSSHI
jgi:hypothetical protein